MPERKRVRTVRLIPAERNTRNLYVAAYIRVSSKKGNQDESYETQAKYYENLIRSNPKWDFVGVYGDKQSGIHTKNRPEFQKMMDDALNRKIDLILCKSVSRWSRNIVDGLGTLNRLRDHFVYVFFEQEGISTEHFGSTLMLNTSMAIAQTESESISDNLKWLYRRRAEAGIFVAHKGKYFGYDTDDGKFHVNDDSRYVLMIYDSFLAGESMTAIADALNTLGIKNSWGNPWQRETVKAILKNEVYVGDVRFQRKPSGHVITGDLDEYQIDKYLTGHHKGIIERKTWDAVQKKLGDQRTKYSPYDDKMVTDNLDDIVLDLIHQGMSGRDIAAKLGITIAREKTSVRRLKHMGLLSDRGYGSTDERENEVLDFISQNQCARRKDILEQLGITARQLEHDLEKLQSKGLIQKTSRGTWAVIEE